MLLVKGPNVMKGYLGQPEETAKVIRDGWYVTGDIALVDTDGFIFITGRLSRFSKIGGEMVPHFHVEEAIQKVLGGEDDGELEGGRHFGARRTEGRADLVVVHTRLTCCPRNLSAES